MRTGAAARHRGYFHEAALYGSDRELLDIALPFLLGGVKAGEPTLVALGEEHSDLIRDALPEPDGITFLTGGSMYARPAAAIQSYRTMLAGHVRDGAGQIRIIGEIPPFGLGATWDWWARYESAINRAYDEFPLWSMCAYDTRGTPGTVLADVVRTHPRAAAPDGSHPSLPDYVEPEAFLLDRRSLAPDPLQEQPPLLELADPAPGTVRAALGRTNRADLGRVELDDFAVAVSEAVTNAVQHGRSPVTVRLWSNAERLVAAVSDRGAGPADPFTGLLPAAHAPEGGLGLWLAFQLCNHVALGPDDDGFTIRLTAGRPPG